MSSFRGAWPSCRCVSANGSRRASRFPDSITCCATAISTAWTTNVRNGWGYAALDNTLRLSRKPDLAFEFGGYYQSEAIQCTYDIGASWRLDAGVKWTFAAGKAELSVKGNDLFDSMTPVSEVDFGEQRLRMGNDFHTRNVTVNFVYRFGGYKDRERKKVDTSRFGH